MALQWAEWLVNACAAYAALGVGFAAFVVVRGPARIDPAARGMPWAARLLIAPGVAGLWPLMLLKWLRQSEPPVA